MLRARPAGSGWRLSPETNSYVRYAATIDCRKHFFNTLVMLTERRPERPQYK